MMMNITSLTSLLLLILVGRTPPARPMSPLLRELTISTSTNEVIVPSSSSLPQTVSFEFCGNGGVLSQLRFQVKMFTGAEITTSLPSENTTLTCVGESTTASIWNGVSEGNRECRILLIRLWPFYLSMTTKQTSVSVKLHRKAKDSEIIPAVYDLSDTYKINFNFVDDDTTPRNVDQELFIQTSIEEVLLSPNDTVPQIVSFVLSGRTEELENIFYRGVRIAINGNLYATINDLRFGTLEYERAQQYGAAASVWNTTSNQTQQMEIVIALWPFRFADIESGNITVSPDLCTKSPIFCPHPLSGSRITFYFAPDDEVSTEESSAPVMTTGGGKVITEPKTEVAKTKTATPFGPFTDNLFNRPAGIGAIIAITLVLFLVIGIVVVSLLAVKISRRKGTRLE